MAASTFLDLHFKHQRAINSVSESNKDAYHEDAEKVDWFRSGSTVNHTYLSMFGGTYHFGNSVEEEHRARVAIARDVAEGRLDFFERPLALAECAFVSDGPVVFPFFLDADIKSPQKRTHEELLCFAARIVVPAICDTYPNLDRTALRVLVCAASEPKDLTTQRCTVCGGTDGTDGTEGGPCADVECTGFLETHPLFKTAVHYRVWNGHTTCAVAVGSKEAVSITSLIYARAVGHPEFRTWGDADAWREWCDVAPILNPVPSLRVLGTVKSSKCHSCGGRKALVDRCILCGGSGKLVDNRPYRVVGCVCGDCSRRPPPSGAAALHATSIRFRGPKTPGFTCPEGVPLLMAD